MEGLTEWLKLLKDKNFLLVFVQTLEEQKKFTVQDKYVQVNLVLVMSKVGMS